MAKLPPQIEKISAKWVYHAPFFSEFLLNFNYQESDSMETMGITVKNRFLTIVYNPEFLSKLEESELHAILVHEIMHVLKLTKQRHQSFYDWKLWNIATDIAINEEIDNKFFINSEKLSIPDWACKLKQIQEDGFTGNCVSEEMYMFIKENPKNRNAYKTIDDHGMLEKLKEEIENDPILKAKLDSLIENAKARGYGSLSGEWKTAIDAIIKEKPIPVQKLFTKVLQQVLAGHGIKKSSWKKINRRDLALKGKKHITTELNVVVDTSGSCWSSEIFGRFFGSIDTLSSKCKIRIFEFDTEVKSDKEYTKGLWKSYKVSGGGGTVIQPVFDYLEGKRRSRIPTVIFTDGEFDRDLDYKGVNPFWVIIQNNEYEFKQGKL